MSDLHPEALSWTVLLGKWIDFAKASCALSTDAEGTSWRDSVPHIITLQAVTFALADLERLEPDDRPHARDRAEIIIEQSETALHAIWEGQAPGSVVEMALDARSALNASVYKGLVELIWPGPGEMIMPGVPLEDILAGRGSVALAQPGTILMPGEPVAWWCDRNGDDLRLLLLDCIEAHPSRPRQLYRVFDGSGAIERDCLLPIDEDPPANAMPLLVPLMHMGRHIGTFTLDADTWKAQQREAMRTTVRVEESGRENARGNRN